MSLSIDNVHESSRSFIRDKPLMVATLALTLLDKLAYQVIAYALEQSGLGDRVRVWLKKDPPRLAFQTAFQKALFSASENRGVQSDGGMILQALFRGYFERKRCGI